MNKPDYRFTSSRSECGIQGGRADDDDEDEDDDVPSVYEVNAPINKHQSVNGYTSLRARKMALRRKRSLSVADLPVPKDQEAPPSAVPSATGGKKKGSRSFGPEESGYDSDTTRKSSPRGSLKNALTGSNSSSGPIGGSSSGDSGGARTASEEGSSSGGHSDPELGSCGGDGKDD